ncbi:hypothetical protein ACFQHO_23965 [Actinomadura yumaensis]
MRTRIRYAHAENQADPTLLVSGGGLSKVPDVERFGSKELADLGTLQGKAFARNLKDPNAATPQLLKEIAATLRENAKNRTYTNNFFTSVPAGSIGKLAYTLHQRSGKPLSADDKRLLGDIGTALAALSRQKNTRHTINQALGPIGSDLPGQALLVGLSAPNVKWSSSVLVDMAKAALRWRQKYPSYGITETIPGKAGDKQTAVLNERSGRWWEAWGLGGSIHSGDPKQLSEYDPALNVLGRIALQKDTTAARTLAATELEKAFTIKDAEKAKPLTWLTRGIGGTYASLLVAPDWPDSGTAAGAVIKLATTPGQGHENEAATNAAAIMQSVAWWNDKGRPLVNTFLTRNNARDPFGILPRQSGRPGWMTHTRQYDAELGTGLTSGLLQTARMYIPVFGLASIVTGGTGSVRTDAATGHRYVSLGGSEIQNFLRTFANDKKAWALLAYDAQRYRVQLYAHGFRTGLIEDATTRAGYLEGSLIRAYLKELTEREKITQKEYDDAKTKLGILRDLVGSTISATPAGEAPLLSETYGVGTGIALENVKYKEFDKQMEAINEKNSDYGNQLYVDLVRGYAANHGGHTGNREIDAIIRKSQLTEADRNAVQNWATEKPFAISSEKEGRSMTGLSLIDRTVTSVNNNAPPPK